MCFCAWRYWCGIVWCIDASVFVVAGASLSGQGGGCLGGYVVVFGSI